MAFLRTANALVVHPHATQAGWSKVRTAANGAGKVVGKPSADLSLQASEILGTNFDTDKYLLTHCTLVASVDVVDVPNVKLGSVKEEGRTVNRKYKNYRITAASDKFLNNNLDGFPRRVLEKSYRTLIGAQNFLEHCQVTELSKGRIIDAVARDIGDSLYVDILVATERKHTQLIADIESGRMDSLSMGCSTEHTTCTKCGNVAVDETDLCFPPGTRVLMADGTYQPIEEVVEGDMVISHKGYLRQVEALMSREYEGALTVLDIDGVPTPVRSTPNHPFWVLRPAQICACGCGQQLKRTVEHERGASAAFLRRFIRGHNSHLRNPNPYAEKVVQLSDYSRVHDISMDFVRADEIQSGDYAAFPIPKDVHQTQDATVNRARLIGYFAAEGCFIKREGKRVGVSFSLSHDEYLTLAPEIQNLLDAEFGRKERRTGPDDWRVLVGQSGVKPIRRRSNSRFIPVDVSCPGCGAPSEYAWVGGFLPGRECYACKVCQRQWVHGADRSVRACVYKAEINGPNTGSTIVQFLSVEAAEFFYKYCGEYADQKRIHPEVMLWEPAIQKHVLFGWFGGDGTQNAVGVKGSSVSFHLACQMHTLAARCGLYAYRSIVFDNKMVDIADVVNGDGVVARDSRGWLPSFVTVVSDPVGFEGFSPFHDRVADRPTMQGVCAGGFKRVGDWLIYRVRSITTEPYVGIVHNIEVAVDHSYIVDGVAVHNCNHIRYEKGNTFIAEDGKPRRIGELCGNESEDPNGGVTFIEASWVGSPAFTGAVMRNIITPEEVSLASARKAAKILSSPPPEWVMGGIQKAAKKADFDFGDAAPADGGAAPADDAPKPDAKPKDDWGDLEESAMQIVRDRVEKRIRDEVSKKDKADEPNSTETTSTNDNLNKSASNHKVAQQAYYASVDAMSKTASCDADLVNKVATLDQSFGLKTPTNIYRVALTVGPLSKHGSTEKFLKACHAASKESITAQDERSLVRLGRILDHHTASRKANSNHSTRPINP